MMEIIGVATCSLLSLPSRSFPRAILASFHFSLKKRRKYQQQKRSNRKSLSLLLRRLLRTFFAFYSPIFWKLDSLEMCVLHCNKFIFFWKRRKNIYHHTLQNLEICSLGASEGT